MQEIGKIFLIQASWKQKFIRTCCAFFVAFLVGTSFNSGIELEVKKKGREGR